MYEVTYGLETIGNYNTFKEAFKVIYDKVNENFPKTWQYFETIWIKHSDFSVPLGFFDARDLACKKGFLKDGKWVN